MVRSSTLFALAVVASTAAIILPAHAYKPGFEKLPKCIVKKYCQQHVWCNRQPQSLCPCAKWKEAKTCD